MLELNRPNIKELAKTYASFIKEDCINYTALPEKIETEKNIERKKKREKFEKKYGLAYTGASLAAGAGIIYALKNGGSINKFTNIAKQHLTRYSAQKMETMKSFSNVPFLQKIRIKTGLAFSYCAHKLLEFGNFIGNINPMKDIAFDKFTEKIKIKPLLDKITNAFARSAGKLSFSKYQKASNHLTEFQSVLQEAAETLRKRAAFSSSIDAQKLSQIADKIDGLSANMTKEMSSITGANFVRRFKNTIHTLRNFSEKEFIGELKKIKGDEFTEKLKAKVRTFKDFVPERVMRKYHDNIFTSLYKTKQTISNNILDLYADVSKVVDDVFYNNTLKDDVLRGHYVKLRNLLAQLKEPALYDVKRAKIRADIIKELNASVSAFGTNPQNATKSQILKDLIKKIETDSKGLVEEAVSSCKELKTINPDLYQRLLVTRNKFQRSLNNAVLFETEKSYRKLLDFSLHSVPTDLLTISIGCGTLGAIAVNDKKSRQEKISLNLKNGIPILGGLLVSFLSNMRLIASGPGAIALGVVSGLILNRLGNVANKKYMKYLKAQHKEVSQNNNPKDLDKVKSWDWFFITIKILKLIYRLGTIGWWI